MRAGVIATSARSGRAAAQAHRPRNRWGWVRVFNSLTKTALALLPFLIMGAVAVTRVFLGPGAGLLPLLALGPAFAATTGGLRSTALAGATALLLAAVLIVVQEPTTTTTQEVVAFSAVGGVTLASILVSVARRRRERELVEVQAVAEVAQQVLLGPLPSKVGSVQLAVRYTSATVRAQIGGDLYEATASPAGLRLIVGDVQGKGLNAVKTAAVVLGAFREAAPREPDLTAIATRIERSMTRQMSEERFVTAILAEIPEDGSKVEMLSCGHPSPLLLSGGVARFLGAEEEGSLPLGLAHLLDIPHKRLSVAFAPGDELLLYTDGVSEARNRAGEFFPLAAAFSRHSSGPMEKVLDELAADVIRHVGHPLDDDAAMLLIRRVDGAPG